MLKEILAAANPLTHVIHVNVISLEGKESSKKKLYVFKKPSRTWILKFRRLSFRELNVVDVKLLQLRKTCSFSSHVRQTKKFRH